MNDTTVVTGNLVATFKNMRQPYRRWGHKTAEQAPDYAKYRIHDKFADIGVRPKFRLASDKGIFTIGSCFARNIERHLARNGTPIADKYLKQHRHVRKHRPNDAEMFNRFTVTSIETEAKAIASNDFLGERLIYIDAKESAWDAYFSPGQKVAKREQKLKVRREVLAYQREFLQSAGAVFITLGLSEGIYDRQDELYLNGVPPFGRTWINENSERFEGHVIGTQTAIRSLENVRRALRQIAGTDLKLILTVSPVPLASTFTQQDVVTANSLSKAVMRVAAQSLADRFDDVDYFPSFEMVNYSSTQLAWESDRRHVSEPMVAHIIDVFMRHYF